ncbi:MAG: (Fe-S)-binding protein [Desulfatiglandaceae bacterium]
MCHLTNEFDQCIKCGLCLATCPVGKILLLEKYTPRGKIQLAKRYALKTLELSDHYRDIFAQCLLCGACTVTCPSGVGLKEVFVQMRAEIVRDRGEHPKLEPVIKTLTGSHNISDEDNDERGEWRDDLKTLPGHRYEKKRARIVYFVGCVASFFPMVQSIPQNMVRILDTAGVDFAVLAGEEWCCGFPLIASGCPEKAQDLIAHNLERVSALGAETIVFSCPSCYCTWKDYYPTDMKLLHSTQFIQQLIQTGAITPTRVEKTVTYHDPCDLGRNGGVFDAPREILRSIPGLTFVELAHNREQSVCCGGGGNLEMTDADLSNSIAGQKLNEIRQSSANTVVTACQQCIRTMKGRVRREKSHIEVLEITDLVVRAIEDA